MDNYLPLGLQLVLDGSFFPRERVEKSLDWFGFQGISPSLHQDWISEGSGQVNSVLAIHGSFFSGTEEMVLQIQFKRFFRASLEVQCKAGLGNYELEWRDLGTWSTWANLSISTAEKKKIHPVQVLGVGDSEAGVRLFIPQHV